MKALLKLLRDIAYLSTGIAWFALTKKNTHYAYHAMIGLFCSTRGKSNDILAGILARIHRKFPTMPVQGVLGTLDNSALLKIDQELKEKGYYVFPNRLPDDICDKLLEFSLKTKATIRLSDEQIQSKGNAPQRDFYDRANPQGIRYDYKTADLIEDPTVQFLFTDPSVLAVANEYLNTKPLLDIVAMWWHTSFSKQPDANAAQFYHFDMDRIKWLKFFFYVTDCNEENGPHCFIAKSHQTGKIPVSLLKKGYARNTDEEVSACFPKEVFIEFVAPRGTILAEDTRGLHKGKHVQHGDRLMFQLEYTVNMFGAEFAQYPKLNANAITDKKTAAQLAKYPEIFSNILPS
jgi:ectoine hydroxylase-related dioxygenase (phytanoyl-CoA dioxygenase family)